MGQSILPYGTLLDGRYRVLNLVGVGGVGVVYRCSCAEIDDQIVAVKVLKRKDVRSNEDLKRFRNEMVACYEINHPNVVKPYEVFQDNGLIGFCMEYVSGGDLSDYMSRNRVSSIRQAVHFLEQIAEALIAIHEAGVIHRDLKPENILLPAQNMIKIGDFGTARILGGPRITHHGEVLGTVYYVSPEYVESGQLDERSDVYALGVIGYELVSGRLPFAGGSFTEIMNRKLHSEPIFLTDLRNDCPPELGAILAKALERDPKYRYQDAREMRTDLWRLGWELSYEFEQAVSS